MKKGIILVISILLAVVLIVLIVNFLKGKSSFNKDFDPSNTQVGTSKKVVWYKLVIPIKNENKGTLFIKTDDGVYDTTRVSLIQTAAIHSILEKKSVLYNAVTNNLIISSENVNDTTTIQ